MTEEQFLEHLKAAKAEWQLSRPQQITNGHDLVLRTIGPLYACPICVVANYLIGEDRYTIDNSKANMHLHLPKNLFQNITSASDGWNVTAQERKIRKLLIKATNPTKV